MTHFLFPAFLLFFEVAVYFSHDMYLVVIPQITKAFVLSEDQVKLTFILWSVGSASLQLFLGPLTHRFGRRAVLLSSVGLFILSTLLCALTPSFLIFCLGRFIQGTAVSSIFVAGYTTVHSLYQGKVVLTVTSLMNAITLVAPALGPLLGAIILSVSGSWPYLFYFLVVMSSLSLVGLYFTTPETVEFKPVNLQDDFQHYTQVLSHGEFLLKSFLGCVCFSILFLWVIQSPFIILNSFEKDSFYYAYAQVGVFGSYIIASMIVPFFCERVALNHYVKSVFLAILVSSIVLCLVSLWGFPLILQISSMAVVAFFVGLVNALMQRQVMESSAHLPLAHKMAVFSSFISLSSILTGMASVLFADLNLLPLGIFFLILASCGLGLIVTSKYDFRLSDKKIKG